jgi:hypothetical protein
MAISKINTNSLADAGVTSAKAETLMQPLGVGQTWQNVTASRAVNTTYTNTTGRPITVTVSLGIVAGGATVNWFYVDGAIIQHIQETSSTSWSVSTFIVPSGSTYKHQYQSVAPTIRIWSELR